MHALLAFLRDVGAYIIVVDFFCKALSKELYSEVYTVVYLQQRCVRRRCKLQSLLISSYAQPRIVFSYRLWSRTR